MKTEQAQLKGQKEKIDRKQLTELLVNTRKIEREFEEQFEVLKKGVERRKEKNGSGITKEKELKDEDCVCPYC